MDLHGMLCECNIPPHMHEGVIRYVNEGCRPGDFLVSVLAHDMYEAHARADVMNASAMHGYAQLPNRLPHECHGSYEAVIAWIKRKGLGVPNEHAGEADDGKHTIYCFNNGGGNEWYSAVALGDDGECIAGHVCSSESWMPHDLGITSDWKHELYDAHFGAGNWKLEWVPSDAIKTHAGLQAALAIANAKTPELAN